MKNKDDLGVVIVNLPKRAGIIVELHDQAYHMVVVPSGEQVRYVRAWLYKADYEALLWLINGLYVPAC